MEEDGEPAKEDACSLNPNPSVLKHDTIDLLKQLDFFQELPKLSSVGQELEDALASFVSECSSLNESKENLENDLKRVVEELHSQQRKLETLQIFHKEHVSKLQEKNLCCKQKFEDTIKSLTREKELLSSQCFQLREEASMAKEDQRIKILELIKLKRDSEQNSKSEQIESHSKKQTDTIIQNLKARQKEADETIDKSKIISKQLQDEIDKLRIENEKFQVVIHDKEKMIDGLQKNLNDALDSKKHSLEQMIKVPLQEVNLSKQSTSSVQNSFPDLFIKSLMDENALLIKNETAIKRKLEAADNTLSILFDQAKRAVELDSEVFKLKEELRILKDSRREDGFTTNNGISEKGDTIIGEKHNEDLSTPADFGSPARLDGEKITSEKPMPTNGSMGQEKETALGSDNEAKNNFVLRPAKLVLKST